MLAAAAVFVRRVRAVHLRGEAVEHRLELVELLLERSSTSSFEGRFTRVQRLPHALVEACSLACEREETRVCTAGVDPLAREELADGDRPSAPRPPRGPASARGVLSTSSPRRHVWTCRPPLASLSSLVAHPDPARPAARRRDRARGAWGSRPSPPRSPLLAARAGKRVLVCEVNAQERIAPLLGAPAGRAADPRGAPGAVHGERDARRRRCASTALMVLKFQTIYDAVFENRLVRHFLRVIPSLAELVMLGRSSTRRRRRSGGRPRWDLVIVDAPATGHAVQLLRVPAGAPRHRARRPAAPRRRVDAGDSSSTRRAPRSRSSRCPRRCR